MARFTLDPQTGLVWDAERGIYMNPETGESIVNTQMQSPVIEEGQSQNVGVGAGTTGAAGLYELYKKGSTVKDLIGSLSEGYDYLTGGSEVASGTQSLQSALGAEQAATAAQAAQAGGVTTVAAGEAIPAGFEAVGQMADGSTMVAPVGSTNYLSAIAPYLGGATALYGLYQFATDPRLKQKNEWERGVRTGAMTGAGAGTAAGAMAGAKAGSMAGPIGALIGAAIGYGITQTGTGKHKDQLSRDVMRKRVKDIGLVGDDYRITLDDGTQYDIGKDGSVKLQSEGGGERRAYEADWDREDTGSVVGLVDPLANLIAGDDKKRKEWMAGYLANAAQSSGDVTANVRKMYADSGLDADKAYNAVSVAERQGRIDADTANAYKASIDRLYDIKPGEQREARNIDLGQIDVLEAEAKKRETQMQQEMKARREWEEERRRQMEEEGGTGMSRFMPQVQAPAPQTPAPQPGRPAPVAMTGRLSPGAQVVDTRPPEMRRRRI